MAVANGTPYGLSSAIYTRDARSMLRFKEEISAGMTSINNSTTGAEAHLPSVGNGWSGNGTRESGIWVLDAYTRWQAVNVDLSGQIAEGANRYRPKRAAAQRRSGRPFCPRGVEAESYLPASRRVVFVDATGLVIRDRPGRLYPAGIRRRAGRCSRSRGQTVCSRARPLPRRHPEPRARRGRVWRQCCSAVRAALRGRRTGAVLGRLAVRARRRGLVRGRHGRGQRAQGRLMALHEHPTSGETNRQGNPGHGEHQAGAGAPARRLGHGTGQQLGDHFTLGTTAERRAATRGHRIAARRRWSATRGSRAVVRRAAWPHRICELVAAGRSRILSSIQPLCAASAWIGTGARAIEPRARLRIRREVIRGRGRPAKSMQIARFAATALRAAPRSARARTESAPRDRDAPRAQTRASKPDRHRADFRRHGDIANADLQHQIRPNHRCRMGAYRSNTRRRITPRDHKSER